MADGANGGAGRNRANSTANLIGRLPEGNAIPEGHPVFLFNSPLPPPGTPTGNARVNTLRANLAERYPPPPPPTVRAAPPGMKVVNLYRPFETEEQQEEAVRRIVPILVEFSRTSGTSAQFSVFGGSTLQLTLSSPAILTPVIGKIKGVDDQWFQPPVQFSEEHRRREYTPALNQFPPGTPAGEYNAAWERAVEVAAAEGVRNTVGPHGSFAVSREEPSSAPTVGKFTGLSPAFEASKAAYLTRHGLPNTPTERAKVAAMLSGALLPPSVGIEKRLRKLREKYPTLPESYLRVFITESDIAELKGRANEIVYGPNAQVPAGPGTREEKARAFLVEKMGGRPHAQALVDHIMKSITVDSATEGAAAPAVDYSPIYSAGAGNKWPGRRGGARRRRTRRSQRRRRTTRRR